MKTSLKVGLAVATALVLTPFLGSQAHAATNTNRITSTSSVNKVAYIRKSASGATYNFNMTSNTNFKFSGRTHNLKNYPNTTWVVTKKAYIVKGNTNTTSLYYYVTNGHGDVSGWIWHGYLKVKPKPAVAYDRITSTSSVNKTQYLRKSASGATYNFNMSGNTNFTFSGRTHNLKNYPHTTWIVTKKAYIVKHNTNTTSLYYYVTNGHGDVSGWIWHGYLTPKPKPVAKAASYAAVYNKAKAQLGKPYAWGAAGANSFDCSGLTQYVYKQAINKQLPRTAQSQYNSYSHVSTNNLKKGDLVFFGSNAGNISHTGIYVGSNKMIDAQNRGVITENIHASWWNLVGASRPANLQ